MTKAQNAEAFWLTGAAVAVASPPDVKHLVSGFFRGKILAHFNQKNIL
jgi:hypothetical protein